MRQRYHHQRGVALVELAMLMPLMLLLLLGVAEVGNAINAYLTVIGASREGARLIVRDGPSAEVEVPGLVQTLTDRFPADRVSTFVTFDDDSVTVEVTYDYEFIFGAVPFVQERILPSPLNIRATTVMPMP